MAEKNKLKLNELMNKTQIAGLFLNITSFLSNSKKDKNFKDEPDLIDQKYFFKSEIWEKLTGKSLDELNSLTVKKAIQLLIESLDYEDPGYITNPYATETDETTINFNSVLPKINYILNNKAGINLPTIVGKGCYDLNVAPSGKKEVLTKINIDYADKSIELPTSFTAYDKAVMNACISWWAAGNTEFTPNQIYRCMNGMTDKETVSPQSVGAVTRSIDKARRLLCTIDYTAEAKMYNKKTDSYTVEDYILSAKKVRLETGGRTISGYQFNDAPILYNYAQISGQIVSIPTNLFNTSSVVRSTNENIVMREYLLRRIEVIKKGKSQNNKIAYDTLFKDIGEEAANSDRIKTVRGYIKKMLGYYVDKKYIIGFEEYKNGRTFAGIKIVY